jgi:hypothetical protein
MRRTRRRASTVRRVTQDAKFLQLQLETIPPYGGRIMFGSWYFVLVIAFVLGIGTWQWECSNLCGSDHCNIRDFNGWTSRSCASVDNRTKNGTNTSSGAPVRASSTSLVSGEEGATRADRGVPFRVALFGASEIHSRERSISNQIIGDASRVLDANGGAAAFTLSAPELTTEELGDPSAPPQYGVIWYGSFSRLFSTELNRFVHFLLSLPRPAGVVGTHAYDITFKIQLRHLGSINSNAQTEDFNKFVFETTVWFLEDNGRSEMITLPTSATSISNESSVVLTTTMRDPTLLNSTLAASIAAVYQAAGYTIATIVIRYLLLIATVAHLIRSTYHNVTASNDVTTSKKGGKVIRPAIFEQKWVLGLQIAFIFYLNPLFAAGVFITPQPGFFGFLEFRLPLYFVTVVVAFMFALITAAMAWTNHASPYPPMWTQLVNVLLFVSVVTLDLVDAGEKKWDWGLEHCPNFQCSTVGYIVYGLLIAFVLGCTVWLRYLRNNLGKKSYLSSRPQQLTMRLFIFIFSTYAIYFVVSSLVMVAIYRGFATVIQYQGLLQVGVICVSFTFVTIMTHAFTYVLRTEGVPIHPSDPSWKRTKWPAKWFQWVALHGGSAYIFYSESEERRFYRIQTGVGMDAHDRAARSSKVRQEVAEAFKTTAPRAAAASVAFRSTPESTPPHCAVDTRSSSFAPSVVVVYDDESEDEWDLLQDDGEAAFSDGEDGAQYHAAPPNASKPYQQPSPPQQQSDPAQGAGYHNLMDDSAAGRSLFFRGDKLLESAAKSALQVPGKILKKVEEGLVDTAIFFHIFSPTVKPFFCLETCIDAFNLAWEAYGVANSAGDATVTTGLTLGDLLGRCCCCCPGSARVSDTVDDNESNCDSTPLSPSSDDGQLKGVVVVPKNGGAPVSKKKAFAPLDYSETPQRSRASTLASQGGATDCSQARLLSSADGRPPSTLAAAAPVVLIPLINTEQYGYSNVAVYTGLEVQVVVSLMDTAIARHSHKQGCIAVAFRGTNNLSNAVQDVRIGHVEWDLLTSEENILTNTTKVLQPRVHGGFLEVWRELRDQLLSKVRELRAEFPDARLLITGHSLGGAIATFCAYELQKDCVLPDQNGEESTFAGIFSSRTIGGGAQSQSLLNRPMGFSPPIVYTFGMPKVGNGAFRDSFNKKVKHFFRVVNESDAVSQIGILGGAHVGIEVDIDRHGNYIIEPMFIERLFRPTKGRGSSIVHHSMYGYAQSLNSIGSRTGLGLCPSQALIPYVDAVMMAAPETTTADSTAAAAALAIDVAAEMADVAAAAAAAGRPRVGTLPPLMSRPMPTAGSAPVPEAEPHQPPSPPQSSDEPDARSP